ncbi:hypothetical protein GW17_00022829 [Ensete ventricosum]|nr:hypothetical protein GW17_00022829 [Ensete ventricosum]RZR97538.1 hypothetical protein BHM03_00026734 [Ensete ventricosum]
MASLLFKEKRGVNFSCVSPASAAICTSIDRRSMVQPSTGRTIDRHTPHLRDPRRAKASVNAMSQTPTKPKTCNQRNRKSLERASDTRSTPGSTRYLLDDDYGDAYFSNVLPDVEPLPPLVSLEPPTLRALMREEPARSRPSAAARTQGQVLNSSGFLNASVQNNFASYTDDNDDGQMEDLAQGAHKNSTTPIGWGLQMEEESHCSSHGRPKKIPRLLLVLLSL